MLACFLSRRAPRAPRASAQRRVSARNLPPIGAHVDGRHATPHVIPVVVGLVVFNLTCCQPADSITEPQAPLIGDTSTDSIRPHSILPAVRSSAFIWGVNGHPLFRGAYAGAHEPEAQINYLDELHVTYYRINVVVDTVHGGVAWNGTSLASLLDVAHRHRVHVLPVLDSHPDLSLPFEPQAIAASARAGYRIGHQFAAQYGARVTHIEAGNELDLPALPTGVVGSDIAQYDPKVLALTTAFLRGMTRGIRAAAPQIRIIVDVSGRDYGFLDALVQDSVDFDVLGCHWYSEMGDIAAPSGDEKSALQRLTAYHKDIWITEAGRRNGSQEESPPDDQASWIKKFAREDYGFEQVKAFFVYELYDERAVVEGGEGFYGLVACPSGAAECGGRSSRKPAFAAYRDAIEEQTNGYQDYIYSLFSHLLLRPPAPAELATWTDRLYAIGRENRQNKAQFIKTFLPQSDSLFVANRYRQVLGRPPTASELAAWTNQLSSGISRRDVTASLCASDEFWTISGTTNPGFVNHLYEKLLTRAPTPAELASAVQRLTAGATRQELIASIVDGDEVHGLVIDTTYQTLLGRAATPLERATDVGRMSAGLSEEGLIAELLDSREFWTNAIHAGLQRRTQPLDQSVDHTID